MDITDALQSFCDFVALNGFPKVSPAVFLRDVLSPCDKSLQHLVFEFERFLKCFGDSKNEKAISKSCHSSSIQLSNNLQALVAIGWMISKYDIFELMVQKAVKSLDTPSEKKMDLPLAKPLHSENFKDACHNLAWTLGRLQMSMKNLLVNQLRHIHLMHQVHKRTQGMSLSSENTHLTVEQVRALSSKEQIVKLKKMTEKCKNIISSYLEWKKHEPTFFTWVEDVIMNSSAFVEQQETMKNFISSLIAKPSSQHAQEITFQWKPDEAGSAITDNTVPTCKLIPMYETYLCSIQNELHTKISTNKEVLDALGSEVKEHMFLPSIRRT